MKKNIILFLLAMQAAACCFAQYTLELSGPAVCKDVFADSYRPTTSLSKVNEISAYRWTVGGVPATARTYIRFDMSALPPNAIITDVNLLLHHHPAPAYANPGGQVGQNALYVQRITGAWTDSTTTWNNQPTVSTTGQVAVPVSSTASQDYVIIVTDLVKDMMNTNNHGFAIVLQNEVPYRSVSFTSTEYADTTMRPRLVITYVLTPSVQTAAPKAVTSAAADMGGTILSGGGDTILASGIVYGFHPAPSVGDSGVVNLLTNPVVHNGPYTLHATGLSSSSTYHYRAYIVTNLGTFYGADTSFTTDTMMTGQSITFGSDVCKDVFADSYRPTEDLSKKDEIGAYTWTVSGVPATARIYIRFDMSAMPALAQIKHAKLRLYHHPSPVYANPGGQVGQNELLVQRVSSAWTDTATNWSHQPSNTALHAVSVAASSTAVQDYVITVTDLVKDMMSSGNYGFLIRLQNEQPYRNTVFASSEYADTALRPRLVITYVLPSSVQTAAPAAVTSSTADLGGNILSNSDDTILSSGIVYGFHPAPSVGDSGVVNLHTSPVVRSGSYTLHATGLSSSVTYHYRAYVVTSLGTFYGADTSFTPLTTGVMPQAAAQKLSTYPNPAGEKLYFSLPGERPFNVHVYNLNGQLLYSESSAALEHSGAAHVLDTRRFRHDTGTQLYLLLVENGSQRYTTRFLCE